MAAAVIPLLGALISAIPTIYSAIVKVKTVKTAAGVIIDVSQIAQDILKDYFKYAGEFNKQSLDSELIKLEKAQLAELAVLEQKYLQELSNLEITADLEGYKLALAQIDLIKTDIATESFYQRGWRPALFWTGVIMLGFKGIVGLLAGLIGVYWEPFLPAVEFIVHYDISQWKEIMMVAIGVGIAGRTYEKVRRRE